MWFFYGTKQMVETNVGKLAEAGGGVKDDTRAFFSRTAFVTHLRRTGRPHFFVCFFVCFLGNPNGSQQETRPPFDTYSGSI